MKCALIVIDMLNDFLKGALRCKRACKIIKPTKELIDYCRDNDIPVIFACDAHLKGIDNECKMWGEHAILNTKGANIIKDFNVNEHDYIIKKRRYSSFFHTDLHLLLKELNVDTVILSGIHTHLCVSHTAADAFQYGYDIILASDCISAFTAQDNKLGMNYMISAYKPMIKSNEEIKNLR